MDDPSHSPMAPVGIDWSAGPPSSSDVRGATDWQTGHRADTLAVFYMVVTETEVTDVSHYKNRLTPLAKTVISGKIIRSVRSINMITHGAFIARSGIVLGAATS